VAVFSVEESNSACWRQSRSEGKTDSRTRAQTKPAESKKRFTDPADLQKAIDSLNASNESDYTKTEGRLLLIERFYKERALADAEYKDNLKKATDAWYANRKNWRKIPPDVSAKRVVLVSRWQGIALDK